MEHWNLSKGKILIICYYCILWNRVSNDKAPVEECSSEFGERSELAWLVDSQGVPGNHLQFQHWFHPFSGSGFKNERKGKVLIFSGSELACSFSPYITAVNASVVGSGPILQENKGNINRMLVKTGKGAKYFYWVLTRTTENEIYLLLMHLTEWLHDWFPAEKKHTKATRKIVIWKYCTKLWQPACIVKRHRLWLTDPRICFANLYISLCPSVTITTFLLLLLWCLKLMSFFLRLTIQPSKQAVCMRQPICAVEKNPENDAICIFDGLFSSSLPFYSL